MSDHAHDELNDKPQDEPNDDPREQPQDQPPIPSRGSRETRRKDLPIGRAIRSGEHFSLAEVKAAWTARAEAIRAHYAQTRSSNITGRYFGISGTRVLQIVRRPREVAANRARRQDAA